MKLKFFYSLVACLISINSYALSTNDILNIDAGVETYDAVYGFSEGVTTGSYYAWDLNDDGVIDATEEMALQPGGMGGISIGSTMNQGEFDAGTVFLGVNTYFSFPDIPVTILSDNGSGAFELDFSGLYWDFNTNQFSLGGNSLLGDSGVATLSCGTNACVNGDIFTLSYIAHNNDPANSFGELLFSMELTGTVSAVPVPASVWLFGSGFLALVEIARRRISLVI